MRHYRSMLSAVGVALLVACGQQATSQPQAQAPAPVFTARPLPTSAPRATAAAPMAASPTPAPPGASLDQIDIALERVTDQLQRPVYATHAGDGSGRLFVVEKAGTIRVVRNGVPEPTSFLDITDRVGSSGSEQGLLSVAFHPQFAQNGRLFVDYTDRNGNTVIARFSAAGDHADPASETVLLQIDQPYANHNGGLVKFGPDGYLYIGMGDGGSGGDPHGNGQNPHALLGKMLRIDVDGAAPYAIPIDNPWPNGGDGAAEVWATGLRNPWRFSFDRATGDLFIADVGQNAYEEIDVLPANTGAGTNFGWNTLEATHCYDNPTCDPAKATLPVGEYGHDRGCSVTGGYVYRGAAFPALDGTYLFGDYCSGRVWGMRQNAQGGWQQRELLESKLGISSFGEDEQGEIYITSLNDNTLYRIVAK